MSAFHGNSDSGIELTDEFAPQRLLFATMIIVMSGAIFYHYFRETILPYTVIVFLFGVLLGLLSTVPGLVEFQSVFKNFGDLPPRLLFHIFLPVLIFEGAFGIRTHVLTRVLPIAITLATVGLMINTFLVAAALKLVVESVNWYAAILLGSVLSATDPVAVVCLLKSLGVDAGLTALIDGEAIMNDGTAIITYVLLFPAAVAGSWETSTSELVASIFQLTIGAVFLGLASGYVMHKVLRACEGDDIMFAIVALTFPFIIFFVADVVCDTSGVLTIFLTGTYLSRRYPSRFPGKAHSVLNTTFEFWVQALNTMLFCMVGIIVSRQAIASISLWTVFLQLYMHVACSICRLVMLVCLWPLLNLNPSFKMRWQHILITAHGGLKGGVATILTLVIISSGALSKEVTELFLHVNLGVVLLSLITNATTSKAVVQYLKLQAKPKHLLLHMAVGMKRLDSTVKRALHRTTMMPTYRKAHFPRVSKLVNSIANPYEECLVIEENDMDCFKNLMMRICKSEIWALRDSERLSEDATCLLTGELHAREDGELLDVSSFFESSLKYPTWISWAESVSVTMADFLHENILEWRFHHDLALFEALVALSFILDSLERTIPDIATTDDVLKFGTDYIGYQRKKIDEAIDSMTREHPSIMASVITEIAAQRVLHAASHAVHGGELDIGFSQRDTAGVMDSIHHVAHQIRDMPIDMEVVSIANVLPICKLTEDCISESLLTLQRECKTLTAKADEYITLNRKDVLIILVGSAASSRSLRALSKSTVSIDTLVVGSEYGTQCHVSPVVFNDDVIALTEVVYGVIPAAAVEDLMKIDSRFAHNVRKSGAGFTSWMACRGLMRDNMMPRYSKVDAYYACQSGKLLDIGGTSESTAHEEEELLHNLVHNLSQDIFYLSGSDETGSISSASTAPFLVPRCAQFSWKSGTLLYAVDFSLAKGALIEMTNEELYENSSDDDAHTESDADEKHSAKRRLSRRADSTNILVNHLSGDADAEEGFEMSTVALGEARQQEGGMMGNRSASASAMLKRNAPRSVGLVYDPATASSKIPFVTNGQLQLLLCLERLQFLAKNYAAQKISSEKRQFLEAEVTHSLSQLIQYCGSLFPAEAAIYRIAIRMGEVDVENSPLGSLRAPRWYRGTGPASPDEALALLVASTPMSPVGAKKKGGGGNLNSVFGPSTTSPSPSGNFEQQQQQQAPPSPSKSSSAAHAHWAQVRKSVKMFQARQKMLNQRSTHAPLSHEEAMPIPISQKEIRLLHNHIEEHEAFLGFVANFVSGHTSRLVSKRHAGEGSSSSKSGFANVVASALAQDRSEKDTTALLTSQSSMSGIEDPVAAAEAAANRKNVVVGAPTRPASDLQTAVSLYQFLRTAKAFINQHCLDDRRASEIVINCLGPDVVSSLWSAQHAMTFWQSCAASGGLGGSSSQSPSVSETPTFFSSPPSRATQAASAAAGGGFSF